MLQNQESLRAAALCCACRGTAHSVCARDSFTSAFFCQTNASKNLYDKLRRKPRRHPASEHVIARCAFTVKCVGGKRRERTWVRKIRGRGGWWRGRVSRDGLTLVTPASSAAVFSRRSFSPLPPLSPIVFPSSSDELDEQRQQFGGHQASAGPAEPGKHQLPVYQPRGNVQAHLLHMRGPLLR